MGAEIYNPNEVNVQGLNTHYAIQNKWIAYIPLQNALGNQVRNLELNLTRFSTPQINIGTTSVSYKGVSYEMPSKVINPDNREVTFEYIIHEDWSDYRALFTWASAIGIVNPVDARALKAQTNNQNISKALGVTTAATGTWTDLIDCQVWLINNFKKRVINFKFWNCFIKSFSELALDYSQASEVHHSFTIAYTNFTIEDANAK